MARFHTFDDLRRDIAERLGVDSDAVSRPLRNQRHLFGRYEDIEQHDINRLCRAVFAELEPEAEYPWADDARDGPSCAPTARRKGGR